MSDSKGETGIDPYEMPPDDPRPSYPWTPESEKRSRNETSIEMLRRANATKNYERAPEVPLTDAERGMAQEEFLKLRPEIQLQIYNTAIFRRGLT